MTDKVRVKYTPTKTLRLAGKAAGEEFEMEREEALVLVKQGLVEILEKKEAPKPAVEAVVEASPKEAK